MSDPKTGNDSSKDDSYVYPAPHVISTPAEDEYARHGVQDTVDDYYKDKEADKT